MYIYIYICVCVCVCVFVLARVLMERAKLLFNTMPRAAECGIESK